MNSKGQPAKSAKKILVKMVPGATRTAVALGSGRASFTLEPLFTSIGKRRVVGAAPRAVWHVASVDAASGVDESAWDVCHSLLGHDFGIGGAPGAEVAEPDIEQQWLFADERSQTLGLVGSCEVRVGPLRQFPTEADPYWFRDRSHSQLDDALGQTGTPARADRVRIAHLDTGFDPKHHALPEFLNLDLQRNFVERDRPREAFDESSGLFNNRGHGTATIGILAGRAPAGAPKPLGGAPFAEVVPIRVANRVVLFRTSTIAQAFDYVHSLCADPTTRVHVVTMSMGGLASQAWADATNALYEAGVAVVTAAGNNFANFPTRNIVFPARFKRVIAACGVMANGKPYADLGLGVMAGNYGPASKMDTAISGCTPNVPWLRLGCPDMVDYDGQGTSAATPQVAAAAALWIQKYKKEWARYPEEWMRVEAVRKALFESAMEPGAERRRLGRGTLRASEALDRRPAAAGTLSAAPPDTASFALLRTLTGLGVIPLDPRRQRMLELEALQLSQSVSVEIALPDPDADPTTADTARVIDALVSQKGASRTLRAMLGSVSRRARPRAQVPDNLEAVQRLHLHHALAPSPPVPEERRLRVFPYDPSLSSDLATFAINTATMKIRWEPLAPGPVGEYLEVVDVDHASGCCYAPVDLDHPALLAQDGLRPSESNPQFHQQMAYAVAMRTIENFERALGRRAHWLPRVVKNAEGREVHSEYVQRLRIHPHGTREANAYYSPDKKALLLGYFTGESNSKGDLLPGAVVFAAVSHDIIAHETTHALLDGLNRYFSEPTNRDSLAFHEAFADIVALLQHFSLPESLRYEIRKTRGKLEQETLLAKLAVQFGQAMRGGRMALRDAIGTWDPKKGAWQQAELDPRAYQTTTEPHARGEILVAAIFSAFLRIYGMRRDELVRLATSGTGVLPEGEIPIPLADRLAEEAGKVASHVLTMCIRALDYCPPVDVNFGEYLRALITADRDLVPDDRRGYRVAFIAAFRERGIFPPGVKNLSPDTLVWEPPPVILKSIAKIVPKLALAWDMKTERKGAWLSSRRNRKRFRDWLIRPDCVSDDELAALGLERHERRDYEMDGVKGRLGAIWVDSVRPARRIGPDGQSQADLVVNIVQTFHPYPEGPGTPVYRGGCMLLIDKDAAMGGGKGATDCVRYFIRKRISAERMREQRKFQGALAADENHYTDVIREPFAFLHKG